MQIEAMQHNVSGGMYEWTPASVLAWADRYMELKGWPPDYRMSSAEVMEFSHTIWPHDRKRGVDRTSATREDK